jgi:catechol 2,3-dioxygenase-like lactoylglutathione lyase family enzyme
MTLPVLRVARACANLERITTQYREGLGLAELGRFVNPEGFDGVILGKSQGPWHLEFVHVQDEAPPPPPHPEQALVLYLPERQPWLDRVAAMKRAGFVSVPSANPYWDRVGRSYLDIEGGRVIVQQAAWSA